MNHKRILTGIAAAAAVALGFTACSENVEVNGNTNTNDGFTLGVSVHQGWNDNESTRAARRLERISEMQAAGVERVITTEGTVEGEPVYMWCNEQDGIDGKGHSVAVASETEAEDGTRGTLMNGHDGSANYGIEHFVKSTFYDNFSIYGTGANGIVASHKTGTANEWTLSSGITWGSNTFYGIAPASAAGVSSASATGFTFTTPKISTDQIDLMVGPSEKINDRHYLFKFRHALSAIKFKLGSFASGYTITELKLYNICQKNTYTFGSGWGTPNTQFSTSVATDFSTTGAANSMITNDGNETTVGTTFLVLPQTLPNDAYAIVTLVKEGESTPRYLNAQLKPLTPTWEAGTTYTYVISSTDYLSNYKFEVTQNPEFTWNGSVSTTDMFTVKSYLEDGGTNTPKAWSVIGYMVSNPGGEFPTDATWQADMPRALKSVQASGSGSVTGENKQVAVYRSTPTETERQQAELRDPTREVKNNLDLSLFKVDNETPVLRTTANTYIVRYGGTYKIPLVMGNTIKGGAINAPEDYSCADGSGWFRANKNQTVSGQNIYLKEITGNFYFGKQTFVDYKNDLVTRNNYKVDATRGEIVWHDFQDTDRNTELTVIKDIAITTDGADGLVDKFLTFRVDEDSIQQGNVVIAVRNAAGKITWSWQIYITSDNWVTAVTEITNKAGHNFTIANSNLGYVAKNNRGTYNFPVRKIKLLIQQTESGELREVVITQKAGADDLTQNYDWDTKYEWGRKDALPGNGLGIEEGSEYLPTPWSLFGCKFYMKNGYSYVPIATNGSARWTYGESIQHPDKRLTFTDDGDADHPQGSWRNKCYINAWSATKNTLQTAGLKTGKGHDPDGSSNFVIGTIDDETDHPVKTIYDPCPPGFIMPPSGVFTNFTKDGKNDGGTANRNISGSFDNPTSSSTTGKGYAFYAKGTSGATVYFPATGRLRDKGLSNWNTNSFVWSATPSVTHDNYYGDGDPKTIVNGNGPASSVHLSFNSSRVRPLTSNAQNMPHSVRPMVEYNGFAAP